MWKKLHSEVDLLQESENLRNTIVTEVESRLFPLFNLKELQYATFLDPRFKVLKGNPLSSSHNHESILLSQLSKEAATMQCLHSNNKCKEPSGKKASGKPLNDEGNLQFSDFEDDSDEETDNNIDKEIIAYKNEKKLKQSDNPITFWSTKKCMYPNLYPLALQYLAIPATSADSERLFNKAGDLINARRTRLSQVNVDKIIFLNRNLSNLGYHD